MKKDAFLAKSKAMRENLKRRKAHITSQSTKPRTSDNIDKDKDKDKDKDNRNNKNIDN